MSRLQELRERRADELTAEGNALAATGGRVALEQAGELWAEARDVRRGHSDDPAWLGEAE